MNYHLTFVSDWFEVTELSDSIHMKPLMHCKLTALLNQPACGVEWSASNSCQC